MSRALRILASAVGLLSWDALGRVGAAIGWLAGSVLCIRRRSVVEAMGRASIVGPEREARAMYAALGAGILELLWLASAAPARRARALGSHVTLDDDLDHALREACARGPVVLAASHTANWELCAYGAARVLAGRGKRLAVVAKPLSVRVFDAFCTELRRACGLVLLAPDGALTAARRVLARGDVVAMPIDQVPDRWRHGVSVPFLGAPALADRGPAALACAAGATLLVVAGTRDGRAQRIHLLAEIAPAGAHPALASSCASKVWIPGATREATQALDAFIHVHPSSWLWLHRRWRAPREVRRAAPSAGRLVATGQPG